MNEINFKKINISIDDYDDLFSDFDLRGIEERNISDDFLDELKKRFLTIKIQPTEIRINLPYGKRKSEDEKLITARLHLFFKEISDKQLRILRRTRRKGVLMLFSGFLLILLSGYLIGFQNSAFFFRVLFVLTEPSGWYFAWSGFENIFSISESQSQLFEMYLRLSKSKIAFESIKSQL